MNDDALDAYMIGHEYFAKGRLDQAEKWWRQAAPGNEDAAYDLAHLYRDAGRLREASAAFAELARRGVAGTLGLLHTVGLEQSDRGELDDAVQTLADAAELGHADAAFNLGLLYAQHGRRDAARSVWEVGVQLGSAESGNNLGALLIAAGDLSGAERAFRLASDRGDRDATFNLGAVLDELGRHAEAISAWQEAADRGHPRAVQALERHRQR